MNKCALKIHTNVDIVLTVIIFVKYSIIQQLLLSVKIKLKETTNSQFTKIKHLQLEHVFFSTNDVSHHQFYENIQ